jgi:hypothetical protein
VIAEPVVVNSSKPLGHSLQHPNSEEKTAEKTAKVAKKTKKTKKTTKKAPTAAPMSAPTESTEEKLQKAAEKAIKHRTNNKYGGVGVCAEKPMSTHLRDDKYVWVVESTSFSDSAKGPDIDSFENSMGIVLAQSGGSNFDNFFFVRHLQECFRFQNDVGHMNPSPDTLLGKDGGVLTFTNGRVRFWVAGVDPGLCPDFSCEQEYGLDGFGCILLSVARMLKCLHPPRLRYSDMEYETRIALELAHPRTIGDYKYRAWVEPDFPLLGGYAKGEIVLMQCLNTQQFVTDPVFEPLRCLFEAFSVLNFIHNHV